MPVISVGIMKTIDQREMQKKKKQTNKQTKTDWSKGTEAIAKGRELNDLLVNFS